MSASMTNSLEARVRGLIFGNTLWTGKPTTLYLAFFTSTTPPDETGAGSEYSGNGYARKAVACNNTNWTVTDATVTNALAIKFANACTADWSGIAHWGLFDKATGGTLLFYGALKETRTFTQYSTANVPIGDFSITLGGAFGTWMANKILKYFFQAQTWVSVPTFYVGVGTNGDADQLYGEPLPYSGSPATGYARGSIANTTAKWPTATAGAHQASNASAIANFPEATADWGQLSYQALLSAPIVTGAQYASDTTLVTTSVTYSQTGYTITVNKTSHGLNTGMAIWLSITSGLATEGYYTVTRIDNDNFTVTSPDSVSTTGAAQWEPYYITVTATAHGLLSELNAQTGNPQHVDLWFQTKDATNYFISRRYTIVYIVDSDNFIVNLEKEDENGINSGESVTYSLADVIAYAPLTSAITVNNKDTTTVPANALVASTD